MKSLVSKTFSIIICVFLVASSFVISFAKEEETAFVSEPGSVLIGVITRGVGEVTGGGLFQPGDTVTLTAVTDGVHDFIAWYDSDKNKLSTEKTLTFTAEETCFISAEFESKTPEEKESEQQSESNVSEIKRQAIWIAAIVAVSAAVVLLVVLVEKRRSKEQ